MHPRRVRLAAQVGKKNRSVGATLMNQDSSRSHSIFTVTIETIDQGAQSVSGAALGWQRRRLQAGRLAHRAGGGCLAAGRQPS